MEVVLLGLVDDTVGLVWVVDLLEDAAVGPVYFVDCFLDLFISEAISVHGVDDETKGEGVPEIEDAALVALVGQLLQVLFAEEIGELVVASVLLQILLEV